MNMVFSTRLAKENNWTKNFTEKAMLEYKKFMYLAATANAMVSPSEIVDIVWHQHLIFTQSYKDFCGLLGKKIQHIPSTHNRAEFEKFSQAKARTSKLYEGSFGKQPSEIWEDSDMYASLNLPKAGIKNNIIIWTNILIISILSVPAFFLLRPIFVKIQSLHFLLGYVLLIVISFVFLELFNRNYFKNILHKIKDKSFIFDLTPLELIYLQKKDLSYSIHNVVNQLVSQKKFRVGKEFKLTKAPKSKASNLEEHQVMDLITEFGSANYPTLLKHLVRKPTFVSIANSMNGLNTYFKETKVFKIVFNINIWILSLVFLIGVTRLSIGVSREKPVFFIVLILILLLALIISYLYRLTGFFSKNSLLKWYKKKIKSDEQKMKSKEWDYFIFGSTVFTASFIPLVSYTTKNGYVSASSSCGNSCGTNCGSSCGGGGGCGSGCGGGCGGCGG